MLAVKIIDASWQGSGTAASGNTVTITQTIGDTGNSEEIDTTLNAALLPTTVVDTLTDTTGPITISTATTTYSYVADYASGDEDDSLLIDSTDRYSANELPEWGNVSQIVNPDDSWEQFTYDSTEGWLTQEDTPLPGTAATTSANSVPDGAADDSSSDVITYTYDPSLVGGGDALDPLALVARPNEAEETINGDFVQATFEQYSGDTTYTRQITDADDDGTWDEAQVVSTLTLDSGYQSLVTPSGEIAIETTVQDDGGQQSTTETYRLEDGSEAETSLSIATANAFGYTISSTITDYTSSAYPETITENTTDGFGRVTASTVTETVNSAYSAVTTTSYTNSDSTTSWFGPAQITTPAGSVTQYAYNSAGQINSQTVNGVSTYDTSDAAGDLIQTIQDPDSATLSLGDAADLRVRQYLYDWQGNVIATKQGVMLDEDGGAAIPSQETADDPTTQRPLTFTQYDDAGQVIASYTYNGTGIGLSDFAGSDGLGLDGVSIDYGDYAATVDPSSLRAYASSVYDDYGNMTSSDVYSVDQTDGTITSSSPLNTYNIYDDQGNLIYSQGPTGLVTRTVYDGEGNVQAVYTTDGGGGAPDANSTTSDSSNLSDLDYDQVIQEVDYQYGSTSGPGYGDVTFITTMQRMDNAGSTTGPLNSSDAAINYVANYYGDTAHPNSVTESVNYGTNRGVAMDAPPSTAPSYGTFDGNDPYLITQTTYTADGKIATTTDPRDIAAKNFYDSLDRVTYIVSAWDGSYDPTVTGGVPPNTSQDQTTEYQYDSHGNLQYQTSVVATTNPDGTANPSATNQVTTYTFGEPGNSGMGNLLTSNNYPLSVIYPAGSSQSTSSTATTELFAYNAVGQVIEEQDQNGIIHHYTYNVLGQLTSQYVYASTIPSAVDSRVTALDYQYDVFGNVILATSMNGSTTINQVQRTYNSLGQLLTDTQEASGDVDSLSPTVTYSYGSPSSGSPLQSITYPSSIDADDTAGASGPVIYYNYSSTLDSIVGRPTSISEGTVTLQTYDYLGLSTPVDTTDNLADGVTLSLNYASTSEASDSGTQYTGLDQFGRITDQDWMLSNGGSAGSVDQFQYGYDADGNELYQRVVLTGSTGGPIGVNYSQLFQNNGTAANSAYDGFNRPIQWQQGALSMQGDGVSRWNAVDTDTVGQSTAYTYNYLGTPSQNGTTPAAGDGIMEFTQVTDLPGQTDGVSFDAFGRPVDVLVTPTSGSAYDVITSYDALGRRISQTVSDSGTIVDDRVFIYDAGGDVIQEQTARNYPNSAGPLAQYVWNAAQPHTLVLVDQAPSASFIFGQRFWVTTDAQGNITALVANEQPPGEPAVWQVAQRFTYTPQGQQIVLDGGWDLTPAAAADISYGFHTQRENAGTKLLYTASGIFDPFSGRIISPDFASIDAARNYQMPNPWDLATPLAVMGAEAGLTGIAGILGGPLAGFLVGWGFASFNRAYLLGQTANQSIEGGFGDASGLSAADAFFNNQDFGTGANLNLSTGGQWAYGALALVQFVGFGAATYQGLGYIGAALRPLGGALIPTAGDIRAIFGGLPPGMALAGGGIYAGIPGEAAAANGAFGGPWGNSGWLSALGMFAATSRNPIYAEMLENGDINETTAYRSGAATSPQHHVFPQAFRDWFAFRGINIDEFTITLPQAIHEAIHGGGNWQLGQMWENEWNNAMMEALYQAELDKGDILSPEEIIEIGRIQMQEFKISGPFEFYGE